MGNRLTKGYTDNVENTSGNVAYTYNNINQLLTETKTENDEAVYSYTYTYDDNGNMLNDPKTGDTYGYDYYFNKLSSISKNNNESICCYYYNGKGELFARHRYHNNGFDINRYMWDENGFMVNEEEHVSIFSTEYTANYGNLVGINGIFVRYKDADETYLAKNAHGDVIYTQWELEIIDNYEYDAFGNLLSTEPKDVNPFRYCGEYFDIYSNTYYLRNRYYNPRVGRFTTIDPIKDGHNWYVYCENSPVNKIDPSGNGSILAIGGAIIGGFVGFLSQVTLNIINGDEWHEGVLASTLGGVVSGVIYGATLNPMAASYTGAATTSFVNAGISMYYGANPDKEIKNALISTVVDGTMSFVIDKGVGAFIKTNNGWFQPQKLSSFFTKSYGKKIMQQSVAAGVINTATSTFLSNGKPNVEMIQEFLDVVKKGDYGYGSYGPQTTNAVAEWQKTLVKAGYLEMPKGVDYGYWGQLTDDATIEFLNDNVSFAAVN